MRHKKVFLVSLAVFGLSAGNAFAHESASEFWMGPWHGGMWLFPICGFIMMIFMCVFATLFFCRRRSTSPSFWNPHYRFWNCNSYTKDNINSETAMDILNRRYANGEISKEEYETIKRDINK